MFLKSNLSKAQRVVKSRIPRPLMIGKVIARACQDGQEADAKSWKCPLNIVCRTLIPRCRYVRG